MVAVALGWVAGSPELDADDARESARRTLEESGVEVRAVLPRVRAGVYDSIPVWRTRVRIEGGTVGLHLARADGVAVYLNDRTPDGRRQLLTEGQFARLRQVVVDPARERWTGRQVTATAAGVVVMVVATAFAVAAPARRPRAIP
jgi:hypothetical protein